MTHSIHRSRLVFLGAASMCLLPLGPAVAQTLELADAPAQPSSPSQSPALSARQSPATDNGDQTGAPDGLPDQTAPGGSPDLQFQLPAAALDPAIYDERFTEIMRRLDEAYAMPARIPAEERVRQVAIRDAITNEQIPELSARQIGLLLFSPVLLYNDRIPAVEGRLQQLLSPSDGTDPVMGAEAVAAHAGLAYVAANPPRGKRPSVTRITEHLQAAMASDELHDTLVDGSGAVIAAVVRLMGGSPARVAPLEDGIKRLADAFDAQAHPNSTIAMALAWDTLSRLDLDQQGAESLRQRIDDAIVVATMTAESYPGIGPGAGERIAQFRQAFQASRFASAARFPGEERALALTGSPAPEIEFLWTSEGSEQYLSDFRGKVVVLDFFATWCMPCIVLFPEVAELDAHYAGYDVVVLGVTSRQGYEVSPEGRRVPLRTPEEEFARMPAFMLERGVTWPVAFSRDPMYNPKYGNTWIPHMVVIDPEGNVRHGSFNPRSPLSTKLDAIDDILREFNLPVPGEAPTGDPTPAAGAAD